MKLSIPTFEIKFVHQALEKERRVALLIKMILKSCQNFVQDKMTSNKNRGRGGNGRFQTFGCFKEDSKLYLFWVAVEDCMST